jgi:hypothetical protein
MAAGSAGLSALALLTGRAAPQLVLPTASLSQEAQARPEAQLLLGAQLPPLTSGGKRPAFIQVPASPLSSSTLLALQTSAQQLTVREETIFEQAQSAPQRELKKTLASFARERPTTTTIETPGTTTTRTVTETVTVPGQESAGVRELRDILAAASALAGEADDRADTGISEGRLLLLTASVASRGDRLFDELERTLRQGGRHPGDRIERALDHRGGEFVRSIERLFDAAGDRGVDAFEALLSQAGSRVVGTLGRVLEATGSKVSESLKDLLVRAGPEVIDALQAAVDRLRPTTTQTITREVTETTPGTVETVTGTETDTITAARTTPPTPAEQRTEAKRQVAAYQTTSRLLAPLLELSTPPNPVPNPAAGAVDEEKKSERRGGPIRRDEDKNGPLDRGPIRGSTDVKLSTPVAVERSGGNTSQVQPPSFDAFSSALPSIDIAA